MTISTFIIFTEEQRVAAMALNSPSASVIPRQINNPAADFLGHGVLVGKYAASALILNNPAYSGWWEMLTNLPIDLFDGDLLFINTAE